MYLIISNNNECESKILKLIKNSSRPIFAYFSNEDNFEELLNAQIPPRSIVINQLEDLTITKRLCAAIKVTHPHISIGVILNQSQTEKALFRYVIEADAELISPYSDSELIGFLKRLHNTSCPSLSSNLVCTHCKSYLLGYDMKLSPSENRILLFLSAFDGKKITAEAICDGCLNSSAGIEAVRVLISRINKKAQSISSRSLILRSHEKGYYINPNV